MAIPDHTTRVTDDFTVSSLISPTGDGLSVVRDSRRAPTGMDPLDRVLGGGIREGDLVLVGGRPGVGKTVVALQWARAVARSGGTAMVASYEHDEVTLLGRLVAMEIGMLELGPVDAQVESLVTAALNGEWGPGTDAGRHPLVRAAVAQMETYADNLVLLPASRLRLDLNQIELAFAESPAEHKMLVIDYVQKVPIAGASTSWEAEGARLVAERMKELALATKGVVVAIAAVDESGLRARRVRLPHLRSAASLSYEADIAIMLNEKVLATSKVHLAYDLTRIEEFEKRIVFSIEKHRSGRSGMDLEFVKDFQRFRFVPEGGFVAETLVDGVVVEA